MKCNICNSNSIFIFSNRLLSKYDVSYFQCENCGFLQTEEPYWLDTAYFQPINYSDTGYLVRNINFSKKLSVFLSLFFRKELKTANHSRFLDYAGGYGIFVRMMRDIGFDYYWSDKYTKNLFAGGFEGSTDHHYDAVTLFECFEHFADPIIELESLVKLSNNIIFSTEIVSIPAPKPNEWWYYGFEHGQHISFYTKPSLEYIAKKYGFHFCSSGSLHFLTKKKIPLWLIFLLKFTRFDIQNFFLKSLKSKTMEDHKFCCKRPENENRI